MSGTIVVKRGSVTLEEIERVLWKHAVHNGPEPIGEVHTEELARELEHCFAGKERVQAVLGIDIYQYSKMAPHIQRVVPSLFGLLYKHTRQYCRVTEEALFKTLPVGQFVHTGDGGFQVFAVPLQAVVFAVAFESFLSAFNGFKFLPRLRSLFRQSLSVRYALTYDRIFAQDDNVFGSAIINNARILARDSLNRFLLDGGTVEWFQRNLVSIESLLTLGAADLLQIAELRESGVAQPKSMLFAPREPGDGVRSVHVQKIGVVTSKQTQMDVFSLAIQVAISKHNREGQPDGKIIVSVGNLNAEGIAA